MHCFLPNMWKKLPGWLIGWATFTGSGGEMVHPPTWHLAVMPHCDHTGNTCRSACLPLPQLLSLKWSTDWITTRVGLWCVTMQPPKLTLNQESTLMALGGTMRHIFTSRQDRLTTRFLLEKPRLSTEPPRIHSKKENTSTWKPRVLGPNEWYSPITRGLAQQDLFVPLHWGQSNWYKTVPHFHSYLHLPTTPESILCSTFATPLFFYLFVLSSTPPTLFSCSVSLRFPLVLRTRLHAQLPLYWPTLPSRRLGSGLSNHQRGC